MTVHRVAIVGISGYSGIELARLLDGDPRFELCAALSDRWRGEALGAHVRLRGGSSKLVVRPMAEAAAALAEAEVALLATPADASATLAPELLRRGLRVIDLSGAFRLEDPSEYPRWYGFEHPAPELLREARYGLPEVPDASGSAPLAKDARLIANPGCYATAAIVSLAPLLAARAIEPLGIFADGKSGVTGAGRKVEERLLFAEVDENLSAYRVGRHQHTPEIELALSRVAKATVTLSFVPHLLPVRRGLLVTSFARLGKDVDAASVPSLMKRYYERAPLVDVTAPEEVTLASVVHSWAARVGAIADARTAGAITIGALDNLLKGAASQAIQNLCAMMQLEPENQA